MVFCVACKKPICDGDRCYQTRIGVWVEADAQDPGNFEAEEDVAYCHEDCFEGGE